VATWRTAIHLLLTLLYGRGSTSQHAWFEVGGDSRRPELSFVSPACGSRRTDGRRRLEVQGRRVARRRRRKSIRAVLDLNKTRRPRTRPPPTSRAEAPEASGGDARGPGRTFAPPPRSARRGYVQIPPGGPDQTVADRVSDKSADFVRSGRCSCSGISGVTSHRQPRQCRGPRGPKR